MRTRPTDLLEARSLFTALAADGDIEVIARTPARLSSHTIEGNLFVPVIANGVSAEYLLDTGANISALSVSEARRLGLPLENAQASGKDYAGNEVSFQTAIVPELHLGQVVLRNVPFGVVPDKQQPFVDLPDGKRGVLGIPILLAGHCWRWSKDGSLEIGFASAGFEKGRENLAFSGATPLLVAEFEGTPLTFHLDTGASSTDLWPAFAHRYHARLSGRGKSRITGVGGSKEVRTARLDTLDLLIAGRPLQLRDVDVLLQPAGSGSRRYCGNLGFDLLEKTQGFTLDFGAMRMTIQ